MISENEFQQYKIGLHGEEIIRELFRKHKIHHFQADLIYEREDKYYLAEIKHQNIYTQHPPPEHPEWPEGPFDGHGLPIWQVRARINFYKKTGVEPYLFIIEKGKMVEGKHILYSQSLVQLEKEGNYYDTNGSKPRRIYCIDSFRKTLIE